MIRRAIRVLPLLAAALVLGLLGTGSFALAHGKPDHAKQRHHAKHHAKGGKSDGNQGSKDDQGNQGDDEKSDDNQSSGDHERRCDKSCSDEQYSAWDEEWLMMSIEGDLFEIQGGKIAQEKGTTQKVRDLGATLVKDHSKSLKEATDLAEELGIEVPSEPSPSQQWELRAVQQFSGRDFDKWYSDLEV